MKIKKIYPIIFVSAALLALLVCSIEEVWVSGDSIIQIGDEASYTHTSTYYITQDMINLIPYLQDRNNMTLNLSTIVTYYDFPIINYTLNTQSTQPESNTLNLTQEFRFFLKSKIKEDENLVVHMGIDYYQPDNYINWTYVGKEGHEYLGKIFACNKIGYSNSTYENGTSYSMSSYYLFDDSTGFLLCGYGTETINGTIFHTTNVKITSMSFSYSQPTVILKFRWF